MAEPCLTDDVVLAFAAGALAASELDAAHAHIDRCDDCRQLVAEAAKAQHETPPVLAGRTVERYQVVRAIGAGGMGIVYLAEDTQLHRKVALKFPRAHAGDEQARMLGEARAMARLAHPNVVTVFEAGTFDDQMFVAMEYVDGITLAQWLRGARRTWREVLAVVCDAGKGLAAAHAAGLVHRDFKPDNVLIDRDGRARVTDFGLAHAVEASGEASPGGTPSYMAPEQLAGATGDARSDQFSFCVTLHEALFGQRAVSATATTVVTVHGGARVLAPASGGGVPAWLRRALERGLAADPAARFASLDELLRALAPPRRSRTALVLGAAAGLAVCGIALAVAFARSGDGAPVRSCGPPPSDECGATAFCSFLTANSCGGAGAPGHCALRPNAAACPAASKPVCACDGKTYDSVCLARASGTGWDHYGTCRGCNRDRACGPKQYCRYPDGDACGSAGLDGVCMVRSKDCLRDDAPVCGCDGTTYANTCEAHAVGAAIAHAGSC